jgi:D-alanyl-D-alanine carboxypeptidase (penicillin-binding protein 5/6)
VLVRVNPAQKYRRRRFTVFGGLAVVLTGLSYLPITLLAPVSEVPAQVVQYQVPELPEPAIDWPTNAATAVGAIGYPGVLAATGTDGQRPIASITKVITALVVLEKHPLPADADGPDISFSSQDVRYYDEYRSVGGMVKPVRSGLTLTQRQLLEVVLIPSANNYAKSLVVWAFGTEAAFLDAARSWLDAHGLTATAIYEPTGMDPRNVSTAAELLELAKLAVAQPTVAAIVSMPTASLPYIGTVKNSNELLGTLGIDGIKTGTIDAAGACLLFSADFDIGGETVTVVGVALGGVNHDTQFPQVRELMASVAASFHSVPFIEPGDVLAKYTTAWGDSGQAVAADGYSQLVWGSPTVSVRVDAAPVALADDGDNLGSVSISVNGTVTKVPLEMKGVIDDPGPAWRLANPFSLNG